MLDFLGHTWQFWTWGSLGGFVGYMFGAWIKAETISDYNWCKAEVERLRELLPKKS